MRPPAWAAANLPRAACSSGCSRGRRRRLPRPRRGFSPVRRRFPLRKTPLPSSYPPLTSLLASTVVRRATRHASCYGFPPGELKGRYWSTRRPVYDDSPPAMRLTSRAPLVRVGAPSAMLVGRADSPQPRRGVGAAQPVADARSRRRRGGAPPASPAWSCVAAHAKATHDAGCAARRRGRGPRVRRPGVGPQARRRSASGHLWPAVASCAPQSPAPRRPSRPSRRSVTAASATRERRSACTGSPCPPTRWRFIPTSGAGRICRTAAARYLRSLAQRTPR